jgi:hypothetical protein
MFLLTFLAEQEETSSEDSADLSTIISSGESDAADKPNLKAGLWSTAPGAGSLSRVFHRVLRLAAAVHNQWEDAAPFLLGLKEGHFSSGQLFAFYGEHLIVIPRLCFAALSFLFTWDNRAECWLTFLLTATLFLLICRAAVWERQRTDHSGLLSGSSRLR